MIYWKKNKQSKNIKKNWSFINFFKNNDFEKYKKVCLPYFYEQQKNSRM